MHVGRTTLSLRPGTSVECRENVPVTTAGDVGAWGGGMLVSSRGQAGTGPQLLQEVKGSMHEGDRLSGCANDLQPTAWDRGTGGAEWEGRGVEPSLRKEREGTEGGRETSVGAYIGPAHRIL